MHIHGMQMNFNSVNPYAAAAEKALAARRSSRTRKRLLKKAAEIGAPQSLEAASMVARWMQGPRLRQSAE